MMAGAPAGDLPATDSLISNLPLSSDIMELKRTQSLGIVIEGQPKDLPNLRRAQSPKRDALRHLRNDNYRGRAR